MPEAKRVKSPNKLRTAFFGAGGRRFSGYILDPADLDRRFTVEIAVDGYPVQVVRADGYVFELAQERVGDGCFGFTVSIDESLLNPGVVVTAAISNTDIIIGSPVILGEAPKSAMDPEGPGEVRWLGRLHFSGWFAEGHEPSGISVLVDGLLIDHIRPSGWSHVGGSQPRAVRAFDLHLPDRFADGDVHQVAVVAASGQDFANSPLTFLAFPDGLRELLAAHGVSAQEGLRAELLDQLLPASVPFSRYAEWRERFSFATGPAKSLRCAVVMAQAGDMDDTLRSLERQTHPDWVAVALPGGMPMRFRPNLVRDFIKGEGAGCVYILFGLSGTVLVPEALQRIGNAFSTFESAEAVYGDVDIRAADGSIWPLAFPAFDYERMLSQGYCAHLFAIRSNVATRMLRASTDLYRLFNSIFDDDNLSGERVVHLPGSIGTLPVLDPSAAASVLVAATRTHLKTRRIRARVAAIAGNIFPAIHVVRKIEQQKITIVIPTRDQRSSLERCVESIRPAAKRRAAEILIVDNDSADPDALRYLSEIDGTLARVMKVAGPSNFARLNNRAARNATGDLLCLLHNSIEALDDHWLEEIMSRIVEADVGAVGALLRWPSGVVQHGGMVLGGSLEGVGTGFAVAHAFNDRIEGDPGYCDLLRVAHECSAVTAACMLTRRLDYFNVGGMDEVQFPVNFTDVDYCLRLRALGRRIVITPHARLVHHQLAGRTKDWSEDRKKPFEHELRNLRSKWGNVLAADPYYSPLLSRNSVPFLGLAWPPGPIEPRVNRPPIAAVAPLGF
jgi:O-antigen biosynthesis protein